MEWEFVAIFKLSLYIALVSLAEETARVVSYIALNANTRAALPVCLLIADITSEAVANEARVYVAVAFVYIADVVESLARS